VQVEDVVILLNNRGWEERVRESNRRGCTDQSKVYSAGIHQETPLNKRQDCKIGRGEEMLGGVLVGGWRVNGEYKDEGLWLMDFIYMYEI
jgi:hypothetical protein